MGTMTFKDLWSRKRRLVGMFTAVMVGVAFLAGTLVLGDTVRGSFGTLFTEANSGTAALVRSEHRLTVDGETEQGAIPASLESQVAGVDGVAATAPLVEGTVQLLGADGDRIGGNGPPTAGLELGHRSDAQPVARGRRPRPAAAGEVVIDRASADTGDLHVGSTTTVLVPRAGEGHGRRASPRSAAPTAWPAPPSPRSRPRRPSGCSSTVATRSPVCSSAPSPA